MSEIVSVKTVSDIQDGTAARLGQHAGSRRGEGGRVLAYTQAMQQQ